MKFLTEKQSSTLIDISLLNKSEDQMFQVNETVQSDAVAMMLYTSGTTGNKKGVPLIVIHGFLGDSIEMKKFLFFEFSKHIGVCASRSL